MAEVFQCSDPSCPRDLEAGKEVCSRCERTSRRIRVDEELTGHVEVRSELVLGGRFRLVRKLGAGGMGAVWLAEDRTLDELVAIKVLQPKLREDRRALVNMKKEVATARKLSHKHIVRVHEFHSEPGLEYISMAFVAGQDLDKYLGARLEKKGKGFRLERILPLIRQAASALDYAHSQGVYHRDVKPGNLLLGDDGRLQVVDFGIARTASDSTSRMSGHITSGTLAYMSPEQLLGQKVGAASDQYSLAVTTYELLSGNPPFHEGDISTQVRLIPPAPLEDQPEHVNAALLKALSKSPEERFASCMAFVDALSGKAHEETSPVSPPPLPEPEGATTASKAPVGETLPEGEGAVEGGAGGRWVGVSLLILLVASIVGGLLYTQSGTGERSAEVASQLREAEARATREAEAAAQARQEADAKVKAAEEAAARDAAERERQQELAVKEAGEIAAARTLAEQARNRLTDDTRGVAPSESKKADEAWESGEDGSNSASSRVKSYESARTQYDGLLGLETSRSAALKLRDTLTPELRSHSTGESTLGDESWAEGEDQERPLVARKASYETASDHYGKALAEGFAGELRSRLETPAPAPAPEAATAQIAEVKVLVEEAQLQVTGSVAFTGMAGRKVEIASYYFDGSGNPLQDRDGTSRSSKGQVYRGVETEVGGSPETRTFTLPLLISQLDLTTGGTHQLGVEVAVWDFSEKPAKEVARSARTPFTVTLKSSPAPTPSSGTPEAGARRTISGLDFVWIPAGSFTMGSGESASTVQSKWGTENTKTENWEDEHPQHKVTISRGFWLGRTEVTVGQFRKFVAATGYKTDAEKAGNSWSLTSEGKWGSVDGVNWQNPGLEMPTGEEYPVIHVSWNDAQEYCKWLGAGFRLPTEAEWEYACRAGTTTAFPWGAEADGGSGWLNGADQTKLPNGSTWNPKFNFTDGYWSTSPVGRFKANRWGLHDMLGNVSEWCSDRYGSDYYSQSPATDPTGPSGGERRVLRGGSWSNYAYFCRSANRSSSTPDSRSLDIGFRVVRTSF